MFSGSLTDSVFSAGSVRLSVWAPAHKCIHRTLTQPWSSQPFIMGRFFRFTLNLYCLQMKWMEHFCSLPVCDMIIMRMWIWAMEPALPGFWVSLTHRAHLLWMIIHLVGVIGGRVLMVLQLPSGGGNMTGWEMGAVKASKCFPPKCQLEKLHGPGVLLLWDNMKHEVRQRSVFKIILFFEHVNVAWLLLICLVLTFIQ